MAISDNTASTMSDWYTKSLDSASGGKAQAPVGSAFGSAPAAKNSASASPDVSSWYTNITGRKAEQAGLDYWNDQLKSGANADDVYKTFIKSAVDNNDYNPSSNKTPVSLDLTGLKDRTVTKGQTVAGQLGSLLDANSDYIQSARDRASRAANARGLTNSSIAASAGEDSAYQAALPIATSDAQVNRDVDAYNAALYNQGLMYNTDTANSFVKDQQGYQNQSNLQQQQINADKATQQANLGSQMGLAQLQAETSKYQADKNSATSQYNTDANTKNQAEQNKTTLVNNIIQSPDLSPDRKAELLKQLGEAGLASAIYVASDIASELDTTNQGDR